MPMSAEGRKIESSFLSTYRKRGSKRAKSIMYATANKAGKGSKIYQALHEGK